MLGQAFGTYLQRHAGRKISLGRDTRLSSPRLRDALMRGLMASGCDVTDLGVVPTPVLYYSVFHLKADGGVMITGSHNPPEFNGFKMVCGASTIHGEAIQEIRRMIETGDLERGEGSETTADVVTPYVDEVAAQFQFPAAHPRGGRCRQRHRRAGDAPHSRAAERGRAPKCSSRWTAGSRITIPIPTVPANLEALIAKVRETGRRPRHRLRRRYRPHRRGGRPRHGASTATS